jgi:hypothetical protein
MKFCGAVIDSSTGRGIVYPWPRGARVLWKYDLLVHNGDQWLYVASSNNRESRTFQNMTRTVEGGGGVWRIVEAKTGLIVRQNPAGDRQLCLN